MRRVFICANANFPRGGAAANYIEYLALALIEQGITVYIFSHGSNRKEEYCVDEKCYCHNGIYYENYYKKIILHFRSLY